MTEQEAFNFLNRGRPDLKLVRQKYKGNPQLERQIAKSFVKWLNYQYGVQAEIVDNKGTWIKNDGCPDKGYFRKSPTCKGFPDIIGWISAGDGARIFFIEVKTDTGSQETEQKMFQARCLETGAPYMVCRRLDDVIRFIGDLKRKYNAGLNRAAS